MVTRLVSVLYLLWLGATNVLAGSEPEARSLPKLPTIGKGRRLYAGWGYPPGHPRHGIIEHTRIGNFHTIFRQEPLRPVVRIYADSWEEAQKLSHDWTIRYMRAGEEE